MIRAHVEAVLARLREDPALADKVFEGVVQNRPPVYCTVFANNGFREVERFTGPQSTATFTFTVHSVAADPSKAQQVAEHVFTQLLGFTPTVAGRRCRRIRHAVSRPVEADKDLSPWLWFCVDEFDLTSEPA